MSDEARFGSHASRGGRHRRAKGGGSSGVFSRAAAGADRKAAPDSGRHRRVELPRSAWGPEGWDHERRSGEWESDGLPVDRFISFLRGRDKDLSIPMGPNREGDDPSPFSEFLAEGVGLSSGVGAGSPGEGAPESPGEGESDDAPRVASAHDALAAGLSPGPGGPGSQAGLNPGPGGAGSQAGLSPDLDGAGSPAGFHPGSGGSGSPVGLSPGPSGVDSSAGLNSGPGGAGSPAGVAGEPVSGFASGPQASAPAAPNVGAGPGSDPVAGLPGGFDLGIPTLAANEALPLAHVLNGRFRILFPLCEDGRSRSYVAEDLRRDLEACVVKEADPSHRDAPACVRAVLAEARLLARLNHPRIPRLIGSFAEGGRAYLVRELVEGTTLEQLVRKRGPQPEDAVRRWMLRVCAVLEYLHGQEPPVIYRDLSPERIALRPDGEACLSDFGAAAAACDRAVRAGVGADGADGADAADGVDDSDGARFDILCCGRTMWRLLTGEAFPDGGPQGAPPNAREANPAVSRRMAAIVAQCCDADPSARYQTAAALADALATAAK